MQDISPCLWFNKEAEQAARYYTSIFKKSRIVKIARYGKAGYKIHRRRAGSVMTVAFKLNGQSFTALNGGPIFKFNEAISLQVNCTTQKEVNYYWAKLSRGGNKRAQVCGWLKDKFGVSWQIVPTMLPKLLGNPDSKKSQRAFEAMLQMKKIDIAKLKKAYDGP